MKKVFILLATLLLSASLVACKSAKDSTSSSQLNIMMWGNDISEKLIAKFEKDNNVKINFTYMNDNADAVNKLTAGAGSDFDLIMTCDAYMQSLIAGGYLEKLDLSKVPNSKNLNTTYWHDKIRDYCIPYLMNYIYVVYDSERCPIEITSYNDLIKPELKGKIGSIDGARNLFPIALEALGYNPNSTSEEEIAKAYEWLVKYNDNVVAYGDTQQNIVSGLVSVILTYDGNAAWAMKQQMDKTGKTTLKIAPFTKDKVQLGMDLYVIPKGAKNTDLSYKFLDYILDDEVMAKNLDELPYSCPNDAAIKVASEEYRNGPAFDFNYKQNIFFQEDVGEAMVIYDKYYQMLKTGK